MSDDLVSEVDGNDVVIGFRPMRDFYTGKYIHRTAHLALFNKKCEILLQKRAGGKRWYPGRYTWSVSGTVEDETYEECIKREMKEEIGISVPVRFAFRYFYSDEGVEQAFHAVFVGKSDETITPDYGEMVSVRWISLEELKDEVAYHPERYTPPCAEGVRKYWRLLEEKM